MWSLFLPVALGLPMHDQPLRIGQPAPGDAAVVVGIEDYAFLPDVPYAQRDAEAFQDLLLYTVGVPADRVQLLETNASKERIETAVAEAAERIDPGGTLWVYFAGHGAASPTTGERMLLGIDTMADAQSFEARSLPIARIEELAPEGARTVLVVDACYAGAGRTGSDLLPGKRFAVPAYVQPAASTFVEWTAAQPNELSGPLEPARHGAFTWAVVGALRGWADGQLTGEADGAITFDEADLYVQEVLRAVDVRDQKPALRVADRNAAAVVLPVEKLEGRPDPLQLKAEVTGKPVPSAPAAEPAGRPDEALVASPAAAPGAVTPAEGGAPTSRAPDDDSQGTHDEPPYAPHFFAAGFGRPMQKKVADCKGAGDPYDHRYPRGARHPDEPARWKCKVSIPGSAPTKVGVTVYRADDETWERYVAAWKPHGTQLEPFGRRERTAMVLPIRPPYGGQLWVRDGDLVYSLVPRCDIDRLQGLGVEEACKRTVEAFIDASVVAE